MCRILGYFHLWSKGKGDRVVTLPLVSRAPIDLVCSYRGGGRGISTWNTKQIPHGVAYCRERVRELRVPTEVGCRCAYHVLLVEQPNGFAFV